MNTQSILRNLVLGLTLVSTIASRAQDPAFAKGTFGINAGIGIGGVRASYLNAYDSHYSTSPTFCLSLERGVAEAGPGTVGVGAFIGHRWTRYADDNSYGSVTYSYDERWSRTTVGVRGAWHLAQWVPADKLDLYAGVMVGYAFVGYRDRSTRTVYGETTSYDTGTRVRHGYADWSTFVGARYFFTRHLGAYAEAGYGVNYLNLGLAFRF
ncbi:MAG: hypothetical protein H6592_14565 [Flavobacteriales bacterium]|nr:hypothetical protein [Flavobacteriales bacterium]